MRISWPVLTSRFQVFIHAQSEQEAALFESQAPTMATLIKGCKSVKVVRDIQEVPAGCGSAILTQTAAVHILVRVSFGKMHHVPSFWFRFRAWLTWMLKSRSVTRNWAWRRWIWIRCERSNLSPIMRRPFPPTFAWSTKKRSVYSQSIEYCEGWLHSDLEENAGSRGCFVRALQGNVYKVEVIGRNKFHSLYYVVIVRCPIRSLFSLGQPTEFLGTPVAKGWSRGKTAPPYSVA